NACISSLVLMIFRPPTSTLFPTRRSSDLLHDGREPEQQHSQARLLFRKGKLCIPGEISVQRRASRRRKQPLWEEQPIWRVSRRRSEEHTSELQSREKLVCRLLLEKKNGTN